MSGGTLGGVVLTEESWTSILDFEKCDAAVDPCITTTGGASYPAAHMHVRKYKPVPGRGDLYALTV